MEKRSTSCRACVFTITWLWLMPCVGSSQISSLVSMWSRVGHQAVLPCTWKSLSEASSQLPSIQWETVTKMVFERMGDDTFQGETFQNRVDVPKEIMQERNCSLFFTDIQFRDAGIYKSYLVVGQSGIKRRIFLQSVQLLVFDHKHVETVESGKDLTLDLYTDQAMTLVFRGKTSSEERILWQRGRQIAPRLEELEGKLMLRSVTTSDSGTYRVMDAEGLALSTVKVSVSDPLPTRAAHVLEKQISFGRGRVNSPSVLVPVSLLLSSLLLYLL